jgi:hypothetical protein
MSNLTPTDVLHPAQWKAMCVILNDAGLRLDADITYRLKWSESPHNMSGDDRLSLTLNLTHKKMYFTVWTTNGRPERLSVAFVPGSESAKEVHDPVIRPSELLGHFRTWVGQIGEWRSMQDPWQMFANQMESADIGSLVATAPDRVASIADVKRATEFLNSLLTKIPLAEARLVQVRALVKEAKAKLKTSKRPSRGLVFSILLGVLFFIFQSASENVFLMPVWDGIRSQLEAVLPIELPQIDAD